MEIDEYMKEKKKVWRLQDAWTENTAKIYYHILQHCSEGLTAVLRTQPNWGLAARDQDLIILLKMIYDITGATRMIADVKAPVVKKTGLHH